MTAFDVIFSQQRLSRAIQRPSVAFRDCVGCVLSVGVNKKLIQLLLVMHDGAVQQRAAPSIPNLRVA